MLEPYDQLFILKDRSHYYPEELFMSSISFRSSRPDGWTVPRPYCDASLRFRKHGPIQPMTQPSLLARLFRLR